MTRPATINKQVEFRIPCDDPSKWSVSLTRHPDRVEIGLHFGDKHLATHGMDVALGDFEQMVGELLQ